MSWPPRRDRSLLTFPNGKALHLAPDGGGRGGWDLHGRSYPAGAAAPSKGERRRPARPCLALRARGDDHDEHQPESVHCGPHRRRNVPDGNLWNKYTAVYSKIKGCPRRLEAISVAVHP